MSRRSSGGNPLTRPEEEGNYLASLSDMMSGLLFIFIITLIVFVINFNMERIEAAEQKQELTEKYDELTNARKTRAEMLTSLERSLKMKGVEVSIDKDHGLLHIPEGILFDSGSAALPPEGGRTLDIIAEQLSTLLPCYSGKADAPAPDECRDNYKPGRLEAVFVEGHTDNVPMPPRGGIQDNWDLSTKRAVTTYRHLLGHAPTLAAFVNLDGDPLFGVSGYAASRPRNPHDTPTPDAQNRRIDLRFLLAAPRGQDKATP
ncbi:OmpA/MotB family protein [Nitratidesulfovibrio vulgaris]|uniref:OmpA/MotB domain protein n=1 Tax=Nitratidesulfovibrio vulgaris (strain DP4) TaxID=391774 RepID=A0A0H3ADI8_NITV4|nr:OmpA family protein [Nitratidesulfovibrio vulgaris]ABM29948.1 OmpA/MotB domain protein [Nitratidesulfovibrio vulgaris DP4]GEB78876.1 chemotaxis protein MotB [Desulfovibrio desulfuricans]